MKQYFLYTILILSIAKLSAQYEFENISVENGLSQSTVYDILKDKKDSYGSVRIMDLIVSSESHFKRYKIDFDNCNDML